MEDKKVDLKLSSISRFGLGRGTRGGAGSSRLPSLKPSRDLSLGGSTNTKRVFTPNIVGRSAKKESDSIDVDSGRGSCSNKHNRGRRNRGDRGRGRERGRGEVIASSGIFSQGIFPKETLAGALSGTYYAGNSIKPEPDDSAETSGGSKSYMIKSVKGEAEEEADSEKILELLADEGKIEIDDNEIKSGGLMPITLPLASKLTMKIKKDTGIKSESSAVETDLSQDEDEPVRKSKMKKSNLKSVSPVNIGDIFKADNIEEGQLFFLQLPDVLPMNSMGQDVDEDIKVEPVNSSRGATHAPPKSDLTIEEQFKKLSFSNVSEGYIGKLQIHKSGKVKMRLGNVTLDLSLGTPCGFLQDLVSINIEKENPDMVSLGHVNHRLIATPDFKSLLGSL